MSEGELRELERDIHDRITGQGIKKMRKIEKFLNDQGLMDNWVNPSSSGRGSKALESR